MITENGQNLRTIALCFSAQRITDFEVNFQTAFLYKQLMIMMKLPILPGTEN